MGGWAWRGRNSQRSAASWPHTGQPGGTYSCQGPLHSVGEGSATTQGRLGSPAEDLQGWAVATGFGSLGLGCVSGRSPGSCDRGSEDGEDPAPGAQPSCAAEAGGRRLVARLAGVEATSQEQGGGRGRGGEAEEAATAVYLLRLPWRDALTCAPGAGEIAQQRKHQPSKRS